MKNTGYFFMVAGVLIAGLGMVQFAEVQITIPDHNPNPVGSGVLMTLCWYLGIIFFGVGGWIAGVFRKPLV